MDYGVNIMRYYVTSDIHSFFGELNTTLAELGFFEDTQPHKLVICGDLFDRGTEALALQKFILELLARDEVILVRGNHEDLALRLLHQWHRQSYLQYHHHTNGTIDTLCQLTGINPNYFYASTEHAGRAFFHTPFIQKIIPAMVDYYETDHYIFVHGWIPCQVDSVDCNKKEYCPIPDWRNADKEAWDKARWINGMEAAHAGITEPGKTIVCGHWHCSFGHAQYENDGGEFNNSPNFNPYYGEGIIALDACTAFTRKINCIVIDD